MKRLVAFLAFSVALSGCALFPSEIGPVNPTARFATQGLIAKDLQSAAYNLDQAVAVGALPVDDPAPKCVHAILVKTGIELAPGATSAGSFAPKNDGVASAGAIAYILAQQAKAAKSAAVDVNCEALLGRVVLDGANAASRVVPVIGALH